MEKTHYCNNHAEPMPRFPCNIFGGITVGYYCVSCDEFVSAHNPEIGVIKKLFDICRRQEFHMKRRLECVR